MAGKVFDSVDPDEKPDLNGYVGTDPIYQNSASNLYTPDGSKPRAEKKVKATNPPAGDDSTGDDKTGDDNKGTESQEAPTAPKANKK